MKIERPYARPIPGHPDQDGAPHVDLDNLSVDPDQQLHDAICRVQKNYAGGTVRISGKPTFYRPIELGSGVTLDFQGSLVTSMVPSGSPCIIANGTTGAQIKNIRLVRESLAGPAIMVVSEKSGSPCLFNRFRKIKITGRAEYFGDDVLGLFLAARGNGTVAFNIAEDVTMSGVSTGIKLNTTNEASGTVVSNAFRSLFVDGFERLIHFDIDEKSNDARLIGANQFKSVFGRANGYSPLAVGPISGSGNYFQHVGVSDWTQPNPDWEITSSAEDTVIAAISFSHDTRLFDDGQRTIILTPTGRDINKFYRS